MLGALATAPVTLWVSRRLRDEQDDRELTSGIAMLASELKANQATIREYRSTRRTEPDLQKALAVGTWETWRHVLDRPLAAGWPEHWHRVTAVCEQLRRATYGEPIPDGIGTAADDLDTILREYETRKGWPRRARHGARATE